MRPPWRMGFVPKAGPTRTQQLHAIHLFGDVLTEVEGPREMLISKLVVYPKS